jgi:hypothetical protein
MRLGGIANQFEVDDLVQSITALMKQEQSQQLTCALVVFFTIFFGYLAYAMVSRIVYELKGGKKPFLGLHGINPGTIFLSFLATIFIVFFASFSLKGFELILLLNFGIFFAFMLPLAASGAALGECIYQSFNILRFNLSKIVAVYLLCMGVAIAAPIALLMVFMFPLSAVDPTAVPIIKFLLSLFAIGFALFYQFVVCSRAMLDFTRRAEPRLPPYTKIARRIR